MPFGINVGDMYLPDWYGRPNPQDRINQVAKLTRRDIPSSKYLFHFLVFWFFAFSVFWSKKSGPPVFIYLVVRIGSNVPDSYLPYYNSFYDFNEGTVKIYHAISLSCSKFVHYKIPFLPQYLPSKLTTKMVNPQTFLNNDRQDRGVMKRDKMEVDDRLTF